MKFKLGWLIILLLTSINSLAEAPPLDLDLKIPTHHVEGLSRSGQEVEIPLGNRDHLIRRRLQKILDVTGWFADVKVDSKEGVIILSGTVAQQAHADWAESLAKDTEGVVAVMNQVQVKSAGWLDLTPARIETENFIRRTIRKTPYILTSLLVILAFSMLAAFMNQMGLKVARQKLRSPLLVELAAKLFALPVVIIGFYIVLRILGLTGMAVTLLGGTGAFGLIAGFAAKNILENYFSGIMLSLRNSYRAGDVIEVAGKMGVVQKLTTRATILVDFDGNQITIPNGTIYGNIITNLTANPSLRIKFSIGISYRENLPRVHSVLLKTLKSLPEVLEKPEPMVLISEFRNYAVNFDIYFWIDPSKSFGIKVKSSAMEAVKARLEEEKIEIPNQINQIVFKDSESSQNFSALASSSTSNLDRRHPNSRNADTDNGQTGSKSPNNEPLL